MMIYLSISIIVLLCFAIMMQKMWFKRVYPQDSVLKQRAVFSINQQLVYARLKKIMPEYTVLAHVSFDSLLTTKYPRTRSKYRNMAADFVILSPKNQVIAIVSFEEVNISKKQMDAQYADDLLRLAGYQVFRYFNLPSTEQLAADLKQMPQLYPIFNELRGSLKKYHSFYKELPKPRLRASLV